MLREGGQYMGAGDSHDWDGGEGRLPQFSRVTSVSGLKSSTSPQLLKCPLSSQSRDGYAASNTWPLGDLPHPTVEEAK